jgi:hypothetical protein
MFMSRICHSHGRQQVQHLQELVMHDNRGMRDRVGDFAVFEVTVRISYRSPQVNTYTIHSLRGLPLNCLPKLKLIRTPNIPEFLVRGGEKGHEEFVWGSDLPRSRSEYLNLAGGTMPVTEPSLEPCPNFLCL